MFFLICPESYQHPNGEGKTVAYYLFDAETWDPTRDIYEQGYVLEVWELDGRTQFYLLDGNVESTFTDFGEALKALRKNMRSYGAIVSHDTEESLQVEYDTYLESENLPQFSIEDLLAETNLHAHQRRMLSQYLLRWQAMEAANNSEDDRTMDADPGEETDR